jgi:hypothetical protein
MNMKKDNIVRKLAIAGILGGILMLTGDMLFYFQISDGENFHFFKVMGQTPVFRLVIGGALGPIAGMLYALGAISIYLALKPVNHAIAALIGTCFVIMFINGGAYHAVFATFGFAARIPDTSLSSQMVKDIKTLHDMMYETSLASGILGTIFFIYLVLAKKTAYPKWIVLILPTLLSLFANVSKVVPYPIGGIVAGGWTNGFFIVFFVVSATFLWKGVKTEA